MKKFFIAISLFLILISGTSQTKQFTLLDYFSGEYTVYTSNSLGEDSVNLGFCYMNSVEVKDCVVGESLVIENFEVGSALKILKAKVVKTEQLENGTTVIYAHTNLINEKIKVSGENVNLQIAIKDNKTTIGWPLILGSF